ncbi:MAG: DNA recombination protein RmuC [Rhodocyclaceae bacterium]|jgi:DNA recombination protein RmuC|nr:DNA recombination protein RmuC [Rhodocyclaceae bacterium]
MPDIWTAAALALVAAAVIFILWRIAALDAATKDVPPRLETVLAEQRRAILSDLHDGLLKQGDRLISHGGESADRLRQSTAAELTQTRDAVQALRLALQQSLAEQREAMMARLAEQARADRELLQSGLANATTQLSASMESLTRTINERLEQISGRVSERLDEGFKKTNETFASVMARLATIDEAQKKIDGLTTNVVSLQELLGDKKARGAFGEVQLEALVRNTLPPGSFEFQYTLSNGTRADCVLKLPEPTGLVAVDSKFPLENYHRMFDNDLSEIERRAAQTTFRGDLRKHIDAIASKYIITNETSDGAVMFVPAEAVFAEIHAYHPEVVGYAMQKRVWIVSPTTLMAVLNTARAVLKDVETRHQIHIIKDALGKLSKDFARFDERMQRLATHIDQAQKDVQEVQVSSRKISGQFARIEGVELDHLHEPPAIAAVPLRKAGEE